MTDELQVQRLAKNEVLFRDVNERIVGMERRARLDAGFVCECSLLECAEIIQISVEEYELVHQERDRFILVKGHEVPEIERVVSEPNGYIVVEKIGPGKPIAEQS